MTKKAKRIWAILGALFIAIAIYAWFYGTDVVLVWQVRQMAKGNPVLRKVPVRLTNLDISKAAGQKVSAGDYEFEVPWQSVKEEQNPKFLNWKSFSAPDGSVVAVFFPVTQNESLAPLHLRFEFVREVLETNPDELTLLAPPKEIRTRCLRLMMKPLLVPQAADSGVYSVQTPISSGFQFGDPHEHPKYIHADLYLQEGVLEFIFLNRTHGQNISQQQINRIVQTVRRQVTAGDENAALHQ